MRKKKVLLLGGAGAIGGYVASMCLSFGYEVHSTTRASRYEDGIVFHQGNAKNYLWLEPLLRDQRYDAIVDFMVYRTVEFESRISSLLSLTDHYVFLSSYRVYDDSKGAALVESASRLIESTENKGFLKTDEYALAKGRQENVLFSSPSDNWSIVRPSITYSNGRFQFGCLEANTILPRAAEGLPVVIPEEMLNKHATMTWAGDAGLMIAKLLFNEGAFGGAFNVCSPESVTWRRIGELYKKYIGLKVTPVDMDSYLSLGLNPYQVKYDRMFDRQCSSEKVLTVTGIHRSELMVLQEGLRLELKKSETKKRTSSMTRIHGRMDRLAGIQRLFKARGVKAFVSYLSGYIRFVNYFIVQYRLRKSVPRYRPMS